ncbi:GTP-binding protein RAD [Patella vulgata]|uniref:GTP-binding protein RAD n=1 Tax=Patella vulgata TaxID=6465 RepID=UPI00217F44F0|nr:GTP-binding protein RAD [Patella vulgata]
MTQGTHEERFEERRKRRPSASSQTSGNSAGSIASENALPVPFGNQLLIASAPHSRASSFRKPRPPSNELEVIVPAFRRNSVPNCAVNLLNVPDQEEDVKGSGGRLQRVRSFKTTSKGVVNRGDSFKKKSSRSLRLMTTGVDHRDQRGRYLAPEQEGSIHSHNSNAPSYYSVIVLGGAGVGKSTLTRQFMTSEYIDTSDTGGDSGVMTVSVLLNGEESTLEFIDPPDKNISIEELQLDAYVVVFSITDKASFDTATNITKYLRVELGTDRAILLVANKTDLVRKRKVSADDARLLATGYDCKYAETSAALNHHLDELLVGILSQIRLKLSIPVEPVYPIKSPTKEKKKHKGPFSIFAKLFQRKTKKVNYTCDNLFTL